MLTTILYFLIVLFATTLGACAGIGGGIIIKPFMDFLNYDDIATISFYSANAVFAMACFSSFKRLRKNRDFNFKIIIAISLSSIIGGLLGNYAFSKLIYLLGSVNVKALQSLCLCILMLFIISYYLIKFKSHHITNILAVSLIGIILGFISAFLSIGGGPANVAAYSWLFGFNVKISVTYSIATILFAQGAQLLHIALSYGYSAFNYTTLFFIIPAALLGGVIGSKIYQKINERHIKYLLISVMIFVLILNAYNLFNILITK